MLFFHFIFLNIQLLGERLCVCVCVCVCEIKKTVIKLTILTIYRYAYFVK